MNTGQTFETILVKLEIPEITLGVAGAITWVKMFKKIITRDLQDKGILADAESHCMALAQFAIAKFHVTDRVGGLSIVRGALGELGLLSCAQIAWWDCREEVYRWWYPAGLTDTFARVDEIMAHFQSFTVNTIRSNSASFSDQQKQDMNARLRAAGRPEIDFDSPQ